MLALSFPAIPGFAEHGPAEDFPCFTFLGAPCPQPCFEILFHENENEIWSDMVLYWLKA